VIVVGTGFAGLLAADACKREHLHPLVLGADTTIGGRWLNVAAHQSLTSLPKYMQLPTVVHSTGSWTAADVMTYLQRDLVPDHLVLHDPVVTVSTQNGTFCVQTQSGLSYLSRGLVLALGTSGQMETPENPRLHTSCWQIGAPDILPTGRRVLIMGMGNTAVDLFLALRDTHCDVRFSVRSCPVVLPHHHVFGLFDLEALFGLYEMLPRCLRDGALALLSRTQCTSIRDWVPPMCPTKSYRTGGGPIVDRQGFVSAIQTGSVRIHPPLLDLVPGKNRGTQAHFSDGSYWEPDDVFVCYGYKDTEICTGNEVLQKSRCVDMRPCSKSAFPIRAMSMMAQALPLPFLSRKRK
jgi:hypothetical protein